MPYNLTGYNTVMGTPAAETLSGGIGNDAVYGGAGDTLVGGRGNDLLVGNETGVTFQFSVDGNWASNITASNAGDPGNPSPSMSSSIAGYAQSYDVFVGTGANNTLMMGDGRAALFLDDPMSPGIDSQRLYNIQTIVMGSGGQTVDLSSTSITYGSVTVQGGSGNDQIWANAGHDTLSGGNGNDNMWGGSGNDNMAGGAGKDTLRGGTGNDVLDGGADADSMAGGAGDDAYVVSATGDVLTELAGEGTDTVTSSITYTLGANVENLSLTGTSNLSGNGNGLDNALVGNSGGNRLTGGAGNDVLDGGAGNDSLFGGEGDDIYVVDSAADAVTEFANQGIDLVRSSVSYTLGAAVENLTLTGATNINGTGNSLANTVTGNAGANTLDGGLGNDQINGGAGNDMLLGGDGADKMYGEDGNDTMLGGTGNDILNGGWGNDSLQGGEGSDGFFGGGGNDAIRGEAGNDNLYGDGGNDTIQGGAGSDLLAGGQLKNGVSLGNDTFVWDRADVVNTDGSSAGVDRLVDFGAGDRLDFTGLLAGHGAVGASALVHATDMATGTMISASIDGGTTFVDVVMLEGIHGVDIDLMASSGSLLF